MPWTMIEQSSLQKLSVTLQTQNPNAKFNTLRYKLRYIESEFTNLQGEFSELILSAVEYHWSAAMDSERICKAL